MSAPSGPGQARRAAGHTRIPPLAWGCHPSWSLAPAADGSRSQQARGRGRGAHNLVVHPHHLSHSAEELGDA